MSLIHVAIAQLHLALKNAPSHTPHFLQNAVAAVLVAGPVALPRVPLHPLLLLPSVAGLQHLRLLDLPQARATLLLFYKLELPTLERLPLCLSNQCLSESAVAVLLTEKK